jgi:hypothetical protein
VVVGTSANPIARAERHRTFIDTWPHVVGSYDVPTIEGRSMVWSVALVSQGKATGVP